MADLYEEYTDRDSDARLMVEPSTSPVWICNRFYWRFVRLGFVLVYDKLSQSYAQQHRMIVGNRTMLVAKLTNPSRHHVSIDG